MWTDGSPDLLNFLLNTDEVIEGLTFLNILELQHCKYQKNVGFICGGVESNPRFHWFCIPLPCNSPKNSLEHLSHSDAKLITTQSSMFSEPQAA